MADDHNPNAILADKIIAELSANDLISQTQTHEIFRQKLTDGKAKSEDWKALLQEAIASNIPT